MELAPNFFFMYMMTAPLTSKLRLLRKSGHSVRVIVSFQCGCICSGLSFPLIVLITENFIGGRSGIGFLSHPKMGDANRAGFYCGVGRAMQAKLDRAKS